jgi:hypothetical protein
MNTEAVNPVVQKARWIAAKILHSGVSLLTPGERVFIAELSRLGYVSNDRTARRLAHQIQVAHLDYQLKLELGR